MNARTRHAQTFAEHMQQTQTLLKQSDLVKCTEALPAPSDDLSQNLSRATAAIMNNGPHDKSNKLWSFLFKPSKPACTYWGQFSHVQKLDLIGPELLKPSVVGSGKAWSPKGDLLKRWNDEIFPQIQGIVDAELSRRFIYQDLKKHSLCTCDLWMVGDGSSCETAHPTIVAICEDRKIAKKTIYVLKRNPQLQDLKLGFNFMECEEIILLTAGEVDELVVNGSPDIESLRLCGSRVVASSIPISVRSQWVQATIGGVLFLNGTYYGLSVAHAFYRDEDGLSRRSPEDDGSDTLRNETELSDDEKDWDKIFDELRNTESSGGVEDVSHHMPFLREPFANSVFMPRDLAKFEAYASGSPLLAENGSQDFLENLSLVGHLPKPRSNTADMRTEQTDPSESQWVSCTLDWVLIRLHDPRFWGRNYFKSTAGETILTSSVAYSPPNGQVIIATRHNGPRITHSWGLGEARLGHNQETVNVDQEAAKGECGAWVIDPKNGCLYGVVVASSQGLDVTYILPAHRILADINERFGSELGGPEDMFPKGEMEPWSLDMDEDIIGQRFQLYEDQQSITSTAPSTSAPPSLFDRPQRTSLLRQMSKRRSLIGGTLDSDDGISDRRTPCLTNPLKDPEDSNRISQAFYGGPVDENSVGEPKAPSAQSEPQRSGAPPSKRERLASEWQVPLTEEAAAVRRPGADPNDRGHHIAQIDHGRFDMTSPGSVSVLSDIAPANQKQAEFLEQPSRELSSPSIQAATQRPSQTEAKQVAEFISSSTPQDLKKWPIPAVAKQTTSAATRTPTALVSEVKDSRDYNADGRQRWHLHTGGGGRYYILKQNGQLGYRFEDGRTLTQREFDQLPCPESGSTVAPRYPSSEQDSHWRDLSYVSAHRGATLFTGARDSRRNSEQTTASKNENNVPRLTQLCNEFLRIPMGSYSKLSSFVVDNDGIVSQNEIDSLIAEARLQKRLGNNPQTLVHHALILRRCKDLNDTGRVRFFKRMDDGNDETRKEFVDGVKKVLATMQGPTESSMQQNQTPEAQSQSGAPLVVQQVASVSRHSPENAIQPQRAAAGFQAEGNGAGRHLDPGDQAVPANLRQQERRWRDKEGRLAYVDDSGRVLRSASSRSESDRGSAEAANNSINHGMREMSVGESTRRDDRVPEVRPVGSDDKSRHVEGPNRATGRPTPNRRLSISSNAQMPTLHEGKAGYGRNFDGIEDLEKTLDTRYKKRTDAKKFFIRGRVFSLLWSESAGQGNTELSGGIIVTRGIFGELVYSHILRMVVVKELHGACLCLPINTYGGRGVCKPGLSKNDREAHAIIYMSDTNPKRLAEEKDINKRAIAVDKSTADQKLDPMSRLNFSRVHTVVWNVKVMDVGKVSRDSMPWLVAYWQQSLQ